MSNPLTSQDRRAQRAFLVAPSNNSSHRYKWSGLRVVRKLALLTFVSLVSSSSVFAQNASSDHASKITIEGTVKDGAGQPLKGAEVHLSRKDAAELFQALTNDAGRFEFSSLPSGTYTVIADKSGVAGSKPEIVSTSEPSKKSEGVYRVDLVVDDRQGQAAKEEKAPDQEMQFADQPNFTIAGVTDWTAAGGHGSDATLRTSEALNREAIALKAGVDAKTSSGDRGATDQARKSEVELRSAVQRAPASVAANRELGAFYVRQGRYREALPFLKVAYLGDPKDASNELNLAIACKESGDFAQSRQHVQNLMASRPNATLHRFAGELDELQTDPLAAVKEFQLAAREDPSEQNYFEWGSELLLHRAIWQAKSVLEEGSKAFPQSARMMTALGAALFAGELYDQAAARLCDASDLAPLDREPYEFMGKIELSAPKPLPCVEQKLARFLKQSPSDALAHYYYAMALWKQEGHNQDQQVTERVEEQLRQAVAFDPQCGDAYLQLGNVEFSREKIQPAIAFYMRAVSVNPQLNDAHYRLAMAYDRAGEREKAKHEFELHDEIAKQQASEVDRQRRLVKQFVVSVPEPAPSELKR